MPGVESWALGGMTLTSGAFTLMELTADPPRARADWISAADSEAAALFRQPLHENRTITMKLRVTPQASMDTALDKVGALVDKLRAASATQAGISLVWTPNGSTRPCTFTVLAGEITGLPIALSGDGYSWLLSSPIVTVEMTCHPYWLGTETLTSTASSSTPFVTKEITGVTGDVPALGRLIVTDTATQSRRHVEWGIEGPLTYNASTSLLVDSDDMVTSGFAGSQTSGGGSYDPNAAGNSMIFLTLAAGQTTALCGTGNLSHVGTFRVKARVTAGSVGNYFRLSWRAGDGPMQSNAWVAPISASGWVELDLGTIEVPAAVVGSQRWAGQFEIAAESVAPATAYLDYLTLIPTSDGYGKARATFSYTPGVVVGYDQFTGTTAAAALNARVAPAGGTWATSGSATDFAFADDFGVEQVKRSTVSDASSRFALLGTSTPTDVEVQSAIYAFATGTGTLDQAVIARWTDSSNYVYATFRRVTTSTSVTKTLEIRQVVAGVETLLGTSPEYTGSATNIWWKLRLVVYASGTTLSQLMTSAGALTLSVSASSSALATAGALASGKSGFLDRHTSSLAGSSRYFDDFAISTPAAEPIALYSGRNMQIRYDDTLRQDSAGTYSGRPQSYRGSRFLVPVGTSRVLVKARRNDVESTFDDNVTDATQIQIGWTPRGLAVPRS